MKKEIEGIEYEQIPEKEKAYRCNGCCADDDEELCWQLSNCNSTKTIWVEVKKEEEK